MRKIWVLAFLMASAGGAQTPAFTPAGTEALDGNYLASLRVKEDVKALGPLQPSEPQRSPLPAGSVPAAQLRHKLSKNSVKWMDRGVRLSQAGDHRGAAVEFKRAVTADPDFASAFRSLGEEYALLGRYAEAEAELRRALTLGPASWIGHYNLAAVLYATEDFIGAERSARRALELSETNVQVHTLLGLLLWRRVATRAEASEHLQFAARSSAEAKELLASLQGK